MPDKDQKKIFRVIFLPDKSVFCFSENTDTSCFAWQCGAVKMT